MAWTNSSRFGEEVSSLGHPMSFIFFWELKGLFLFSFSKHLKVLLWFHLANMGILQENYTLISFSLEWVTVSFFFSPFA